MKSPKLAHFVRRSRSTSVTATVPQSLPWAMTRRHPDRGLARDLARATKDGYVGRGSKNARAGPHKKTEAPPGHPNIRSPTAEQLRAMQ